MPILKLLTAILGIFILSGLSICSATVVDEKISLGGIAPGISEEVLTSIMGKPISRDDDDLIYKNFTVEIKGGIVEEISTRSDTITTPDGIRVGLDSQVLNSTFGKADKLDYDYDGVEYKYFNGNRTKKIEFKTVNGIITKISCKLVD
ncbi:MAG: hypothetical protein K6G55_02035 [Selenomonadaceae bacterium]|nr:hypothetical protein [Selenomonadaceae bacterium]